MNLNLYRQMMIELLWPELMNIDIESNWFQQHGVTSHFAINTIDLKNSKIF